MLQDFAGDGDCCIGGVTGWYWDSPTLDELGADDTCRPRARVGDNVIHDLPVDSLFLVGPATSYTTVMGNESYAIPLLPLNGLAQDQRIQEVIAAEKSRRVDLVEKKNKKKPANKS